MICVRAFVLSPLQGLVFVCGTVRGLTPPATDLRPFGADEKPIGFVKKPIGFV